jgi:hypothetical protein
MIVVESGDPAAAAIGDDTGSDRRSESGRGRQHEDSFQGNP